MLKRFVLPLSLLVVAAACSSGGDGVVFDNETVASTAPADSTTTSVEPSPTAPNESTTTSVATADETTTTTAFPSVETAGNATALPGRLLVAESEQQIVVLDEQLRPIFEVDTGAEGVARQANWAPDGSAIAWSHYDGSTFAVRVATLDEEGTSEYLVNTLPFYLYWRPDSQAIAALGPTGDGSQTALTTIDLASGAVTAHHGTRSFYIAWSPDGTQLVTHLDAEYLELYDLEARTRHPVTTTGGQWEAAQFTPDGSGIVFIRPADSSSVGGAGMLSTQTITNDELVVMDVESGDIEVLAAGVNMTGFSISPDGSKIGFNLHPDLDGGVMTVLDFATGEPIATTPISALENWQWSPDSQRILLMAMDLEDVVMTFRVWTAGDVTEYTTARPTAIFYNRYYVFWGQYDRSHSVWAPDSSGFVFSANAEGVNGIYYQALDADLPVRVGDGVVATFPRGR